MGQGRRSIVAAVLLLPLLVLATSCGSGGGERTVLQVSAAASLTEAFTQLGNQFERSHDDVNVRFNFAGSQDLVVQIQQGAPVDVVATADEETMGQLVDDDLVEEPSVFAHNRLQIIVPAGNPAGIRTIRDLARPDVTVVLAAPEVPVGGYTQQVLTEADVAANPSSLETDVKAVVSRVVLGEADAGVVYATDVRAAGDKAEGIDIPEASGIDINYPVAVVGDSEHRDLAQEFEDFLLSSGATLERFGFVSA